MDWRLYCVSYRKIDSTQYKRPFQSLHTNINLDHVLLKYLLKAQQICTKTIKSSLLSMLPVLYVSSISETPIKIWNSQNILLNCLWRRIVQWKPIILQTKVMSSCQSDYISSYTNN